MNIKVNQIRKDHKLMVVYMFDNGTRIKKILTAEQYQNEYKKTDEYKNHNKVQSEDDTNDYNERFSTNLIG
jgi:hypothetical protein